MYDKNLPQDSTLFEEASVLKMRKLVVNEELSVAYCKNGGPTVKCIAVPELNNAKQLSLRNKIQTRLVNKSEKSLASIELKLQPLWCAIVSLCLILKERGEHTFRNLQVEVH